LLAHRQIQSSTDSTLATTEKREDPDAALAKVGECATRWRAGPPLGRLCSALDEVLPGVLDKTYLILFARAPSSIGCIFSLPGGYERHHTGGVPG
jgi:hypothetical protein